MTMLRRSAHRCDKCGREDWNGAEGWMICTDHTVTPKASIALCEICFDLFKKWVTT
jgi:hypothetical protein